MSKELRLLAEQELRIDALRAAIIKGVKSGTPMPFDMAAYIALKRRTL